jgi:hypothetical protein
MATCFSTAFLNHHDSYTTLVDSNHLSFILVLNMVLLNKKFLV